MDLENRLRNHLAEQASGIPVDGVGAGSIMEHSPRGNRPLTALAAVLLIVAGGAGFWWFTAGDEPPTTGIAAVEGDSGDDQTADDTDDTDGGSSDGEGAVIPDGDGSAAAGAFVALEAVNITDENSPGSGRVVAVDGVYYVLSTSPGRVDMNRNRTDAEWQDLYRMDTFYIYDGDGWSSTEVNDRFISDYTARDGILYAVSTGSTTGTTSAFGSSSDGGQTWQWEEIPGITEASSIRMLQTTDGAVLFAYRYGYPDYQDVINAVSDAGINVDESNLETFDHNGFSYFEVDPDDPCSTVGAYTMRGLGDFFDWFNQTEGDEREAAIDEWAAMTDWMREEFEAAGCPWDERLDSPETAAEVDLAPFVPKRMTWDEIGFETPEAWTPWATTVIYDGSGFTETGVPYGDDVSFSYATVDDGQLTVATYSDQRSERYYSEEGGYEEHVFRTKDGINWIEETISWENEGYYGPGYLAPVAGPYEFRVNWEDIEYVEEGPATTIVVDENGNEIIYERVHEEPSPALQRRTNGGQWESIDPASIAPGVDLGDKQPSEVHGSPNGVLLVFSGQYGYDGPPEPGIIVLHSNNGTDWGTLEFPGNHVDLWSHRTSAADETQLVFSQRWAFDVGDRNESEVFLVRPAG
jgi:hypothetical protein